MPLIGIPNSITPELLYILARMGHGDYIVIADANFPSDSVAASCIVKQPVRVHGSTSLILSDIMRLFPLDQYDKYPVKVMDRVDSDKAKDLNVPAYATVAQAAGKEVSELEYVERFNFYEKAKGAFAIIQSDDVALYANVIVMKGVL